MKSMILSLILLFLPSYSLAFDGEIYFESLFDSEWRAFPARTIVTDPERGIAGFFSGVELGHRMGMFRPYIKIETIIDQYNDSGWFAPVSVKYDLGIRMDFWKMMFLEAKHVYWHPIGYEGWGEMYRSLRLGIKFGNKGK